MGYVCVCVCVVWGVCMLSSAMFVYNAFMFAQMTSACSDHVPLSCLVLAYSCALFTSLSLSRSLAQCVTLTKAHTPERTDTHNIRIQSIAMLHIQATLLSMLCIPCKTKASARHFVGQA